MAKESFHTLADLYALKFNMSGIVCFGGVNILKGFGKGVSNDIKAEQFHSDFVYVRSMIQSASSSQDCSINIPQEMIERYSYRPYKHYSDEQIARLRAGVSENVINAEAPHIMTTAENAHKVAEEVSAEAQHVPMEPIGIDMLSIWALYE